ncbi:UNVERIFIED_CONTAM: hypothetical protein FKN15_028239 [Acipenser sinensis]
MPQLEVHKKGREVLLAFKKGSALSQACEYRDVLRLAKAAEIIRRQMLDHKSKFFITFRQGCVEESIPPALLQFVCMIEYDADIKSQLKHGVSKSDLAIAQLLQYNCYTKYKEGAKSHRHYKDHESPCCIYVGITVFAKTWKRQLID